MRHLGSREVWMVCFDGLTQGHTIARSPGHWLAAAPYMCPQFVIRPFWQRFRRSIRHTLPPL